MTDSGNRQPAAGNGQSIDDMLYDLTRMLDVRPSPDFAAHVRARVQRPATADRQGVDVVLEDLSRMLEVTPSPDFGANVLARVQRAPTASSSWTWRWGFVAGAAAAVVLLAVFIQLKPEHTSVSRVTAQTKPAISTPAIPVPTASLTTGTAQPATLHREHQTRPDQAVRRSETHPQILIAPDQAAAVRTLLDRFARGNVPSTSRVGAEDAPATLEINELAPIPPIVIPPLDAPPNPGGAGSRK